MFYEYNRSVGANYLSFSSGTCDNFVFPLHLHQSFELVCVSKGTLRIQIEGEDFEVSEGQAALIFPYQLHAYLGGEASQSRFAIFSADYLPELRPEHFPVFSVDVGLIENLESHKYRRFKLRSILYDVAAIYVEGLPYKATKLSQENLICRIVQYLEAHYTEKITLQQMATDLGYHYRYLSGVVNRCFGFGFSRVVNQYRVDLACRLLKTENISITEIASRCGFDSIRNFNRSFKELTGKTPREYAK